MYKIELIASATLDKFSSDQNVNSERYKQTLIQMSGIKFIMLSAGFF